MAKKIVHEPASNDAPPVQVSQPEQQQVIYAQPQPVYAQPQPAPVQYVQVPSKSGGSGCGKCFLVGCILLLLCCCVTSIVLLVASYAYSKQVENLKPSSNVTKITNTEAETIYKTLENKMDTDAQTPDSQGNIKVTLTEKELLALVLKNNPGLSSLGIDIEPGYMKMQIENLSEVFEAIPSDQRQNVDLSQLKDMFLIIELESASDGKQLKVKNVQTNNFFVNLIVNGMKAQIEEGINQSLAQSNSVESIVFKKDSLEITYNVNVVR